MKITQSDATRQLEHALSLGNIVVIENAGEATDSSLLSILRREISEINREKVIKFNDKPIDFSDEFFCYVCSQYSNPHFTPEVQQMAKVLEFSVTRDGLEQ